VGRDEKDGEKAEFILRAAFGYNTSPESSHLLYNTNDRLDNTRNGLRDVGARPPKCRRRDGEARVVLARPGLHNSCATRT
jgi:hypothetical protein